MKKKFNYVIERKDKDMESILKQRKRKREIEIEKEQKLHKVKCHLDCVQNQIGLFIKRKNDQNKSSYLRAQLDIEAAKEKKQHLSKAEEYRRQEIKKQIIQKEQRINQITVQKQETMKVRYNLIKKLKEEREKIKELYYAATTNKKARRNFNKSFDFDEKNASRKPSTLIFSTKNEKRNQSFLQ